jgi:hypothetical protein
MPFTRFSYLFLFLSLAFSGLYFYLNSSVLRADSPDLSAYQVDVELVLAVDVSFSMDEKEQALQRQGYIDALTSQEFIEAVKLGPSGRIAIAYLEWGARGEHRLVADWHIIEDSESAMRFAKVIEQTPIQRVTSTSISSAIDKATAMIISNVWHGLRRVIDISGDGVNNHGGSVVEARNRAIGKGIIINGLPFVSGEHLVALDNMALDAYYAACVIGGPGAFLVPVKGMDDFAQAIRTKLVLEIAGYLVDQAANVMMTSVQQPEIASCMHNISRF